MSIDRERERPVKPIEFVLIFTVHWLAINQCIIHIECVYTHTHGLVTNKKKHPVTLPVSVCACGRGPNHSSIYHDLFASNLLRAMLTFLLHSSLFLSRIISSFSLLIHFVCSNSSLPPSHICTSICDKLDLFNVDNIHEFVVNIYFVPHGTFFHAAIGHRRNHLRCHLKFKKNPKRREKKHNCTQASTNCQISDSN